jgi:diaminopimelate epimerase
MEFTKMHGLGNDFILLDGINQKITADFGSLAIKLCDRHLGIGADGIEVAQPSQTADIRMRIINSDGSEPRMCGNGIRCFAKFVYEQGLVSKQSFAVETLAGLIYPELQIDKGEVTAVKVDMGQPVLSRSHIPMMGSEGHVINELLSIEGVTYQITSLLMAVPHTMIFVDDASIVDLLRIGPGIEKHPAFPQGTNVNFVQVLNEREIIVRTWERGAGSTLACGTGSCAAVVASVLNHITGRKVTVHLAVGDLEIEWNEDGRVYMTGPAVEVFRGEI